MTTFNILYKTGELNRIVCAEHDAKIALAFAAKRSDVVRAWVEVVA